MLEAFVSPAVVATLIICVSVLVLAFRCTNSASAEYIAAVDQLIEDHQVFHEGLESHIRKIESLEKQLEEQKKQVTNLAVGRIR